jgi:Mn-dependent DtxR family transcriptional regulator
MKKNKNESVKISNGNTHGNEIVNQSQTGDVSHVGSPNPIPNRNYGSFDFGINQEFIEENKKMHLNLVKHRQNFRHKFAPFTKSQRRKRRSEVYKLHFEHGMPATRIAEIMKVDRNTINNDLKVLYQKGLNDYNPDSMSLDDIVEKQLLRLETQRDRLGLYLSDVKDVNDKIAIERLIANIDFKLIGAIEKVNHNSSRFWDVILKKVNNVAEIKKLDMRYTSLFELHKISIESRKSLNKIREEALKENKGISE